MKKLQSGRGGPRKGAGRPKAVVTRKKITTSLLPDVLAKLDKIGPTRGKAIEKIVKEWEEEKSNKALI